jgi:hypothetical protein
VVSILSGIYTQTSGSCTEDDEAACTGGVRWSIFGYTGSGVQYGYNGDNTKVNIMFYNYAHLFDDKQADGETSSTQWALNDNFQNYYVKLYYCPVGYY